VARSWCSRPPRSCGISQASKYVPWWLFGISASLSAFRKRAYSALLISKFRTSRRPRRTYRGATGGSGRDFTGRLVTVPCPATAPSATKLATVAELSDDDRAMLLSFLDALVTRTRLKRLTAS